MKLIDQAAIAKKAGNTRFMSSVPCPKCGCFERYVTVGTRCVDCLKNRKRDKQKEREYQKKHYENNKEKYVERNRKAYLKRKGQSNEI